MKIMTYLAKDTKGGMPTGYIIPSNEIAIY